MSGDSGPFVVRPPGAHSGPFGASKVACFFPTFRFGADNFVHRRGGSCMSHRSGVGPSDMRTTFPEKTHWFLQVLSFFFYFQEL